MTADRLAGRFAEPAETATEVSAPSPELLAANRRLLELRVARKAEAPQESAPPSQPPSAGRPSLAEIYKTLPAHLGWESEPATAVMRARFVGGPVGEGGEEQAERSCVTAENLPSTDKQAAVIDLARKTQ